LPPKDALVRTYHLTKVLNAPLNFAYRWCTDFRDSDPQITGSKNKREILEKTKARVIYTIRYENRGRTWNAVNIVTLHPPRSWHLDSRGEEDDEIGEYRLSRLGPSKTRLDMTFVERWKFRGFPSNAEYLKQIHNVWDKYAAALDKDYRRRR
jgi:hypothetical protein